MNMKYWLAVAMMQRGGSFVAALGNAIKFADDENWVKINYMWPEIINKYTEIAKQLKAEDDKKP